MKNLKRRCSIPAEVIESLYTNDSFFNEVMRLKKMSLGRKFPRSDQWRDEEGFNLSFALAGYSPSDILIEVNENTLTIKGQGMEDPATVYPRSLDVNASDYSKKCKQEVPISFISRGIARRKFCVKHLINEEFDVANSTATMENGLLRIFIPDNKSPKQKIIEIKVGR